MAKRKPKVGADVRTCRECGCTDDDCRGCIERTGIPCAWSDVEPDVCTACEELGAPEPKEASGG